MSSSTVAQEAQILMAQSPSAWSGQAAFKGDKPVSPWPTRLLGQVAELERTTVSPALIEPGTPYVGLEHMVSGGDLTELGPVTQGELKSTKFRFTSKHILYGKLRPYLAKIAAPEFDGICSTEVLPILPGTLIDRRFLLHFLRQPSQIELASSRATGANLPRISPTELVKFKVPVPPLPEQRRIAAILDQADALRAKRRAALAQLDQMAQAIFTEMFGDPDCNPRRWIETSIGELMAGGPQNGLYKPATNYGDGTPILRIDSFYNGVVTRPSTLKRLRLSKEEINLYALSPEDIVVNRVNSMEYLGKSALVPKLSEPTVFESNMMRFSLNRTKANPRFIMQLLQSAAIKDQIRAAAKHAVNQSSINQTDVAKFRVICPPMELQRTFAGHLDEIDKMRELQHKSQTNLFSLFASLQHRAFTGAL